uniref:EF-hand domain-containing protein n=1 Tax=Aegilops tauschii subsp. strangulata TaxID=200361 RepID=A0A453QPK8_AEGTS
AELHALIIGINFEELDFDKNDAVDKIMDDFDTSGNDTIDEGEFVEGMKIWLNEAKRKRTREEHDQLAVSDEEVEPVENPGRMIVKAVGLMLVGAAIPAAFADPLVDAIYSLSKATHVSSFFVSFVVLPLVNNSSEVVSAVRSMRKKRRRSASLALSEVPHLHHEITMMHARMQPL